MNDIEMNMAGLKIALLSLDIAWGNREENYRRTRERLSRISSGKDERIDLLVLPEMFATGFDMDIFHSAEEPENSPTAAFMSSLAAESGIHVIGGVCTRGPDNRGLNRCMVFSPDGSMIADYVKRHLFPLAGEPSFFNTGNTPCTVEIRGIMFGLHICYDLRFPEDFRPGWILRKALSQPGLPAKTAKAADHPADSVAIVSSPAAVIGPLDECTHDDSRRHVDAAVVIANWPATRDIHWRTLLRARAIENQCYVLGCNRTGEGGGLLYCGSSMVIDPFGEIVKDDEKYRPWITAEIDRTMVEDIRNRFPFMS